MSAWEHNDLANEGVVSELVSNFLLAPAPMCRYCSNNMERRQISNKWRFRLEDYSEAHESWLDFDLQMKETGIALKDLELGDDSLEDISCYCLICKVCGWWVIEKQALLASRASQVWQLGFAAAGTLKNLDLTDISIPAEEVKKLPLS